MSKYNPPVEKPLRIFVNDKEFVTIMVTPDKLEELLYGWLWSNNLISTASDIIRLMVDIDRSLIWAEIKGEPSTTAKRTISSGCGGGLVIGDMLNSVPKITSDLRISLSNLADLQTEFLKKTVLYKETGGVHGAALADTDKIIFVAEDIGRHNTVDKVIGWSLMNFIDLENKIILTTGRISSEMLFKVAKAGLPIVGSLTAVTDLSVKLAEESGIVVVGYLRKNSGAVYGAIDRIELNTDI